MRWRARLFPVGCVVLLALLIGAGCPALQWERARREQGLVSSGFSHHRVRAGDAEVDYWVGGEGPPVVLIHGFGASALWQWPGLARALAREHQVLFFDLLWFGGSRSANRDYSIDHQVRVLVALLDRLGLQRVDLVGLSYGGFVAYELASAHPRRVGRVVLSDSPAREFTRADYRALLKRFQTDHMSRVLLPTDERGVQRLLDLAFHDPPWTPGFVRRQTVSELYGAYREEQAGLLDWLVGSFDRAGERSHTYRAPTLLIWGREDPIFPVEIGQRLARRLGAPIEIIPRARHAPHLEHPRRFHRLVRRFLRPVESKVGRPDPTDRR